jgi:hexosaminidase
MKNLCILVLFLLVNIVAAFATDNIRYSIIPKPISLEEKTGEFKFSKSVVIAYPNGDARTKEIAEDFAAQLNKTSGLGMKVTTQKTTTGSIILQTKEGFANEEYVLSITPQQIVVSASTSTGIHYGIQSIYQLLPPQVYGETLAKNVKWAAPCCEIHDAPRFAYRGLMLDVGRYFMPKETVKKFISTMAMHKQNMFHWHLTEDQGWRIEIKKYPRLTKIGSIRKETVGYKGEIKDNNPHSGFYTQDDVREIVEYARRHCVTVIPEIDLPGHATAAIAAYPELSCFPDSAYEVATSWGIKKDVFCPSAITFQFLEDVFTELFALFPSPYYHIGGDECPRDKWKESQYCQDLKKVLGLNDEDGIQLFFVQRMTKFLKEKGGKTVIGWDEILDGGAVPSTVVMSYRGHNPAIRAAHLGMNTVLAANRWNYLDYYQEDPDTEERSQGLFLPLKKVYDYFPIPDTLPETYHKYIIGQQGCVWGEYMATPLRAEYLTFPRAVAMAEVAWTDKPNKDYAGFCQRMLKDFERLDMYSVRYSTAFWNVIIDFDRKAAFPKNIKLSIDYPNAEIIYSINGKKAAYADSIMVNKGDIIKVQGFYKGKKVGKEVEKKF